jgi:hypothetical protein
VVVRDAAPVTRCGLPRLRLRLRLRLGRPPGRPRVSSQPASCLSPCGWPLAAAAVLLLWRLAFPPCGRSAPSPRVVCVCVRAPPPLVRPPCRPKTNGSGARGRRSEVEPGLRCVPSKRLADGRTYGRRGARTVGGRRPAAALRWNSTATHHRAAAARARREAHATRAATKPTATQLHGTRRGFCLTGAAITGVRPVSPWPSRRARRHRCPRMCAEPTLVYEAGGCLVLRRGPAGGCLVFGGGCFECGSS